MKITALTENTSARPDICFEHGLSLYIETGSRKILFDMGQTEAFAVNAEKLGIDLSAVDIAVLSHGHYDHGGGLKRFLAINKKAPVYLSRCAFEPHFNRMNKNIGLDPALQKSERLVFTGEETVIDEALTLYACNKRDRLVPIDSDGLQVWDHGALIPEDFRHEQVLLISEKEKRVLVSGCSHKGILNIAGWFRPDVLVGGFHLMHQPLDDTLADLARMLHAYPTTYYTCHCTGEEQFAYMKPYMERLHYLSAGQTITV